MDPKFSMYVGRSKRIGAFSLKTGPPNIHISNTIWFWDSSFNYDFINPTSSKDLFVTPKWRNNTSNTIYNWKDPILLIPPPPIQYGYILALSFCSSAGNRVSNTEFTFLQDFSSNFCNSTPDLWRPTRLQNRTSMRLTWSNAFPYTLHPYNRFPGGIADEGGFRLNFQE